MKTFLEEVAEEIASHGRKDYSDLIIIFPNKRAGVFFRKSLSDKHTTPVWAPEVFSLQEFIVASSQLVPADQLDLIRRLYKTYQRFNNTGENFEQFYFWGQMLLKDFDEVDKNLVDPKLIFSGVKYQKEIEKQFFLSPEQVQLINQFWSGFGRKLSRHQADFLFIWERLHEVYLNFKDELGHEGLAFEGMIYRHIAENFNMLVKKYPPGQKFILAGFNALLASEEKILKGLMENFETRIFWDLDRYYLEDRNQEAGFFLQKYKTDPSFKPSFPDVLPANLQNPKKIRTIECTQQTAQVKMACEMISHLIENGELDPESTVLVLPDEQLLLPLLNSLPAAVKKFNITMGFSFQNTLLYELVQSLFNLQLTSNQHRFNHKPVRAILSHPFLMRMATEDCQALISQVKKQNKIWIKPETFAAAHPILRLIFQEIPAPEKWFDYLHTLILQLQQIEYDNAIEKEFLYHFLLQVKRMQSVFNDSLLFPELKNLIRLFNQVIKSLRLPFAGEPLQGLQIMGVLETRNLDFENVFIFSMNEGQFPSRQVAHSFIPYNLRKAFRLPTVDQQDAIYAYMFYRLIQRASNVWIFYQNNSIDPSLGERSRFLQQLKFEAGFEIEEKIIADPVNIPAANEIRIKKDREIYQLLQQFTDAATEPSRRRLTPSSITTYLDCRLKFYFHTLARIYESDEVNDDIDARAFGILLHGTVENLYKQLLDSKGTNQVEKSDFGKLGHLLDQVLIAQINTYFGAEYSEGAQMEGKVLLIYELVKNFTHRILAIDRENAPFEIIALEYNEKSFDLPVNGPDGETLKVGIKGVIDRVDKKDGKIRVIDYKTGKDQKQVSELAKLFDRTEKRRNKAVLQVLLYGIMQSGANPGIPVVPGIYNSRELYDQNFDCRIQIKPQGGRKYEPLDDVAECQEEFTQRLSELVAEIWDPEVDFDQTDDWQKCKYCTYAAICHRD